MAEAALFAMRDPRRSISSMLVSQGGKFAVGADPGRNAATAGAHATNDRVESNFGCLDILMRMWRHATVESVSGMAQQMRMHHFDSRSDHVVHDRRKAKGEVAPTVTRSAPSPISRAAQRCSSSSRRSS